MDHGGGVEIRAAAPGDRTAVLELAPRLAEGVASWRDQEQAVLAGRRWLDGSLDEAAAGEGAVFVAVEAGAVVGVISVKPQRHFTGELDGYIGELAVAVHASRRGVGRILVTAAADWAAERGLANLTLHTGAANTTALAFYAALGFATEEVRLTMALRPEELL